jgi:hypothetical protein
MKEFIADPEQTVRSVSHKVIVLISSVRFTKHTLNIDQNIGLQDSIPIPGHMYSRLQCAMGVVLYH